MDVRLPQLAEGVEGGTVVSILVAEGKEIKKDQPFIELETQKAVGSIPAPESGIVRKIHVKEGMEVAVGQLLITIDTEASADAAASAPRDGGARESDAKARPVAAPPEKTPSSRDDAIDYRYESKSGALPPAAPSIRKIARELDIDLTRVKGSQAGGRIVLADVREYIRRLQAAAFKPSTATPSPGVQPETSQPQPIDFSKWGPVRREKLSSLRRTVSRRVLESWTTIPKINQFDDADISDLLALRKKYSSAYDKRDAHLTLTSFILKTLGDVLQKHPRVNASLDEATQEIVLKDYCHIGVAVDTEGGLIVPVVRDVNKKSLVEVSHELHELTEKARARKISVDELQGGTFTVSNQGSIGGSHFTPIIYQPQAAILGVGRGQAKAVVVDEKITIRTMLPLCLAYDHRLLDGADAVRFLKDFIAGLAAFPEAQVKLKQ
jgi:pyruvate dehydrogenase E2 component (dihydrolipoamide acetyltransferase)